MLRSARRPCKACDGTSSSADSLGTGCIFGNLIKELLKASRCAACLLNIPLLISQNL